MPPFKQRLRLHGLSSERSKLSYRPAIACDRYLLAAGNSVDYLATMVA